MILFINIKKSLIYKLKSSRPRSDPRGIPCSTLCQCEILFDCNYCRWTLCFLSTTYDL